MFAPLVLFIYLTVVSTSTADTSKTIELGKVIDVRETDVQSDFQEREITIFESIDPACFIDENQSVQSSRKFMQYYANTNSFYSSLATETELDPSLQSAYTLGASLKVATKSTSSKESKVSGMSLNALAVNEKILLRRGCLEGAEMTLKTQFLEDLELLPVKVNAPWESNSWELYHTFLKKYGTHVITSVTRGSSFRQMTFAESSKSYSQRDFEVKSCLSVAGPTSVGMADLNACSDITQSEKSSASRMSTSDKVFVLGGTADTRNKLLDQETRSVEQIQQLLDEARESPSSIEHTFLSIWDMLQARFEAGTPNNVRSLNMEYYYLGFLNHGCPYVQGGGVAFQKFDYTRWTTDTSPEFECTLAKEGCHSNNDCHYKPVWCSCHGDSCVRYKTVTQSCSGVTKETAYANKDSNWGWSGCGWRVAGSECACYNTNRNWRKVVWSRPSKDAPTHKARNHGDHRDAKVHGHRKPKGKERD
ncbi:DELTA-alicitoxin-Pse2b-like isoform X1 [Oculina patagonica]